MYTCTHVLQGLSYHMYFKDYLNSFSRLAILSVVAFCGFCALGVLCILALF